MALDPDAGTVYLVTASLSARRQYCPLLLHPFRCRRLQPARNRLDGAVPASLSLFFLMRARSRGWTTKRRWFCGAFLVLGVSFAALYWQYDAVVLSLSPRDFRISDRFGNKSTSCVCVRGRRPDSTCRAGPRIGTLSDTFEPLIESLLTGFPPLRLRLNESICRYCPRSFPQQRDQHYL